MRKLGYDPDSRDKEMIAMMLSIHIGNRPRPFGGQGPSFCPGFGGGIFGSPFGPGAPPFIQMMQMMFAMLSHAMEAQRCLGGGIPQGFSPGQHPQFGGGGCGCGPISRNPAGLGSFLGAPQGNPLNSPVQPHAPQGFGATENTMTPASGTGSLTKLADDPKERMRQIAEAAKRTYPNQPHMAKLAAAQAVLESGLAGKKPSGLASKHNNLFGIKGKGTAGSVNLKTGEHLNGQNVTITAGFAKNATLEDSFAQHKNLLSKSRYSKVMGSQSFEQAAYEVKKAGYATAPNYTDALIRVYKTHLAQYF